MIRIRLAILCFLFAFVFGCSTKTGLASFYADSFHGKKTASGEPYDKNKLTCAHTTLPFGTKLVVTNLSNQKQVIVRVNDRGPYSSNRILDMSKAAAKKLDFVKKGVTEVHIETLGQDSEDTEKK